MLREDVNVDGNFDFLSSSINRSESGDGTLEDELRMDRFSKAMGI